VIESAVTFLQMHVIPLGTLGVFLASFIEEVIAPIPSAVVVITAGFLFLSGPFSILLLKTSLLSIALPAAIGVTIGSLPFYYVSYYFGETAIRRWGKWFGFSWSSIEKIEKSFRYSYADEAILFGLRIFPIVPNVALNIFFGIVRMNIWRYLLFSFLGTYIRALILALIGWQVGALYYSYATLISSMENTLAIVILAAFIVFLISGYLENVKKRSLSVK